VLLFAYGTLKDAAHVAAVVGRAVRCSVVGSGTIPGILYDVGDYPALRPSEASEDVVAGLLLELDDAVLDDLDAYEGVAEGLYIRQRCEVRLDDGRTADAWVYIYIRDTAGLRRIAAWPPRPR
jgi:gamma-glutamylcyclotransferase (GGCT)/AIG2-like uncharacterized protein YtfP